MLEYILAFVRARLCVLAPCLPQGEAGLAILLSSSIKIGLLTLRSHMSVNMPRGSALTDMPYADLVLHLHTSMSGFKEEHIDGCFFRATYTGKGGAYDLTSHYSLLVRRNDRSESPMRLCTIISCMAHGPGC